MICSYCGGKYSKHLERCPHCQSENPFMVEKRKAKVKHAIDKEAQEKVKDLPEKKVNKIHTIVIIVLAGLLSLLILGGGIGIAWSKYSAKVEYAIYQKHVENLENMIAQEQWDKFYEYYSDFELWDSKYEKYSQIMDVGEYSIEYIYYCYDRYVESLEDYQENDGYEVYEDSAKQYLSYTLEYASDALSSLQKYINDRAIMGNEKLLMAWEEELILFLKEKFEMTEEEIDYLRRCDSEEELQEIVNGYLERDLK